MACATEGSRGEQAQGVLTDVRQDWGRAVAEVGVEERDPRRTMGLRSALTPLPKDSMICSDPHQLSDSGQQHHGRLW